MKIHIFKYNLNVELYEKVLVDIENIGLVHQILDGKVLIVNVNARQRFL